MDKEEAKKMAEEVLGKTLALLMVYGDDDRCVEALAASLLEVHKVSYASGVTDGVLKAAERWQVDPARPNYLQAVADERRRLIQLVRSFRTTSKVGPDHVLSWESACLSVARRLEEQA
jgi:hypothetical protein